MTNSDPILKTVEPNEDVDSSDNHFRDKNCLMDTSFGGVPQLIRDNLSSLDKGYWHYYESHFKNIEHSTQLDERHRAQYIKCAFMNFAGTRFDEWLEFQTGEEGVSADSLDTNKKYAYFENYLRGENEYLLNDIRSKVPNFRLINPFTQEEYATDSFLLYRVLKIIQEETPDVIETTARDMSVIARLYKRYTSFVTDRSDIKGYYGSLYRGEIYQANRVYYDTSTEKILNCVLDLNDYLSGHGASRREVAIPDDTSQDHDSSFLPFYQKHIVWAKRNQRPQSPREGKDKLKEVDSRVKEGLSLLYQLGISPPLRDPDSVESAYFAPDAVSRYALGIAMLFGKRQDLVLAQQERRRLHLEKQKEKHLQEHSKGRPFVSRINPGQMETWRKTVHKDPNKKDALVLNSGLDMSTLMDIWKRNYNRENTEGEPDVSSTEFKKYMSKNWDIIAEVEGARPGAALILFNEFGIANFSRYTSEMLIDQYDHRDDPDVRYFVSVSTLDDHNEAFSLSARRGVRQRYLRNPIDYHGMNPELYKQLKERGVHLRAYEVSSGSEIMRKMVEAGKRYAALIAGAIVQAHGTEKSMLFSIENVPGLYAERKVRNQITLEDISEKRVGGISRYFEDGASIILRSCSTGKEGGIADVLHQATGLKTIGPSSDTSVESTSLHTGDNGELIFEVEYRGAETKTYQ